ncbi:PEPxxWA-CTERM sorting domain-containing protein [Phenylobacterium sp.]|uniref:PEPxxWA-CTERM sorting domain-containing protein n=1 Tax=Phenylobacterium sp. TaxID=1871053 RepID=UPI00374D8CE6
MKPMYFATIAAAAILAAGAANATAYNFNVLYSGGGVATLAAGSDDPLATTMNAGDSFTYTLTGQNGGHWNTIGASDIFPLFAMNVAECGNRTGDRTLNLNNGATNIFTDSVVGDSQSCVHLGTNTVHLEGGMQFDQWQLIYSITSADVTSSPSSLLPWPGQAPEEYRPGSISYTAGVPEPAAWALMIAGFGLVGGTLRARHKKVAVSV